MKMLVLKGLKAERKGDEESHTFWSCRFHQHVRKNEIPHQLVQSFQIVEPSLCWDIMENVGRVTPALALLSPLKTC